MIRTVAEISTRPLYRLVTGIPWFDSITTGGLVRGSAMLLHGAPGAGKSTMLAQVAGSIRGSLYISLEEDLSMVAARCRRLGVHCLLSSDLPDIREAASVAIVDSIQMTGETLATVRSLVELARDRGIAVILVCHETKSGVHAGARTIEHLTDVTLALWREPRRIVAEKNRFGPAGVYLPLTMTGRGLAYEDDTVDVARTTTRGRGRPRWRGYARRAVQ